MNYKAIKEQNKSLFEITTIPEIQTSINDEVKSKTDNLINNYLKILEDSKSILDYSMTNNLSKPIAMYNFLFYLEIYFKNQLLKNCCLDINAVDKYEHNIYLMLNYMGKNCEVNFDGLKHLLRKIKDKNGVTLDISKYYNFKYNKFKDSDELIFESELTEEDKKIIEDVIKWLNTNMLI